MKGHTPGPWTIQGVEVVAADGRPIVWEIGSRDADANARLIAAAPDLLAALKDVVDAFGPWHTPGCPSDDTCACLAKPFHDQINAAIQKAEGP